MTRAVRAVNLAFLSGPGGRDSFRPGRHRVILPATGYGWPCASPANRQPSPRAGHESCNNSGWIEYLSQKTSPPPRSHGRRFRFTSSLQGGLSDRQWCVCWQRGTVGLPSHPPRARERGLSADSRRGPGVLRSSSCPRFWEKRCVVAQIPASIMREPKGSARR